jgi:hypothetical protein
MYKGQGMRMRAAAILEEVLIMMRGHLGRL